MSVKPRIEDFKKVLAVEGYSDLLFYAEALEHVGKKPGQQDDDDGVFIKHFNGASDLTVKLETFLSSELLAEKSTIGIIVDADDDAAARIQSIADILGRLSDQTPWHGEWSQPGPDQARLGFFVAPNGQEPGEIENLAWNSWANDAQNSAPRQCVDDYMECMEKLGIAPDSPAKGKVSTLLAVKNDEDPRLGPGARVKVFSFDRPEFRPLVEFLKGM